MSMSDFLNTALCTAPGTKAAGSLSAWKSAAAARGEQAACLLLATVPLAERMLLYHAATAAWLMLPERGQLERYFLSCYGRLGLSRQAGA
jgi:hypothetical protein